jgi:hypothetical protein
LNNKLNDERATSSLVPQKYEVMHQALLRKYSLTHLVPTRTKYDTYDTKYIVGCIYKKKMWKLLSSKMALNNGYKNQQEATNKSTLLPSGGVVIQYITTG